MKNTITTSLDKQTETSDYIKSKLPTNIKIGGKIINEGEIIIDDEEMPKEEGSI